MPDGKHFMAIHGDVTSQEYQLKVPVARNRNLTNLVPAGSLSLFLDILVRVAACQCVDDDIAKVFQPNNEILQSYSMIYYYPFIETVLIMTTSNHRMNQLFQHRKTKKKQKKNRRHFI